MEPGQVAATHLGGARGGDTALIRGGAGACPRCGGKVFELEMMRSKSQVFHRACFTCGQCQARLDYSTMHSETVMDSPRQL